MGADGGGKALLGEQRRVDATSEFAQRLQRAAGLGLELGDQRPFPLLILAGHRLSQGQRFGDGEQLVLCAVVDIALDPPPLVVCAATIRSRDACSSASLARSCSVRPMLRSSRPPGPRGRS